MKNTNKKRDKQNRIKRAALLKKSGYSVKEIATSLHISKSTPRLKRFILNAYSQIEDIFELAEHLDHLSYKDICCLRRKFNVYGHDKLSKINAIVKFLSPYYNLRIVPGVEKFTMDDVKRAFKRRAKEVHPDLNQNLDKSGAQFKRLYQDYNAILQVYV